MGLSVEFVQSLQYAMRNPFGIDIVKNGDKFFIPVGSAINCIGYNDYLERMVGIARTGFALLALAYSSDRKERVIAAGHIFRGVMEMMGNFEAYLLGLDIVFTVVNLANKFISQDGRSAVVMHTEHQ